MANTGKLQPSDNAFSRNKCLPLFAEKALRALQNEYFVPRCCVSYASSPTFSLSYPCYQQCSSDKFLSLLLILTVMVTDFPNLFVFLIFPLKFSPIT